MDQFIDLIFRNQRKLIRSFAAGSVNNVQNPTVRFNKMINKLHHAFEMLIMATALIMLIAFHCSCRSLYVGHQVGMDCDLLHLMFMIDYSLTQ